MNRLYEILSGPVLWAAFVVFVAGLALRLSFLYGLSRERDRILYNHAQLSWGLRSIGHWLLPWGSRAMRQQPVFGLGIYIFHLLLLAVPLFLPAHNALLEEAFGFRLWCLRDAWADLLTWLFLVSALFLLVRRLVRPEVRILTGAWDYLLLLLTMAPFITGALAYRQWGPYELLMVLHVFSGEMLLVLIPFSKLGHMILFFFTRAFIGFEMGARRGAPTW